MNVIFDYPVSEIDIQDGYFWANVVYTVSADIKHYGLHLEVIVKDVEIKQIDVSDDNHWPIRATNEHEAAALEYFRQRLRHNNIRLRNAAIDAYTEGY